MMLLTHANTPTPPGRLARLPHTRLLGLQASAPLGPSASHALPPHPLSPLPPPPPLLQAVGGLLAFTADLAGFAWLAVARALQRRRAALGRAAAGAPAPPGLLRAYEVGTALTCPAMLSAAILVLRSDVALRSSVYMSRGSTAAFLLMQRGPMAGYLAQLHPPLQLLVGLLRTPADVLMMHTYQPGWGWARLAAGVAVMRVLSVAVACAVDWRERRTFVRLVAEGRGRARPGGASSSFSGKEAADEPSGPSSSWKAGRGLGGKGTKQA